MANPKIQLKRGTDTAIPDTYVLSAGEVVLDTTNNKIIINTSLSDQQKSACMSLSQTESGKTGSPYKINCTYADIAGLRIYNNGIYTTIANLAGGYISLSGGSLREIGNLQFSEVAGSTVTIPRQVKITGEGNGLTTPELAITNSYRCTFTKSADNLGVNLSGSLYITPDTELERVLTTSDAAKIGPDYANAINIGFTQLSGNTPQTYTAPSSGYAIIYSAGGVGGNLRVDINGIVYFVAAAGQVFSHTIPLSTGDILKVYQDVTTTTSWNFGVARFVPLKLNT